MDLLQTIVLALIQGLTEFLPVSSSAHLILPSKLLDWKDQGLAFDVAVHVGTLLAVMIYFRHDILQMCSSACNSLIKRQIPTDKHGLMFYYICLATIPVGLAGLIFKGFIEQYLRSELVIAISTIVFGLLLLVAEKYNKKALTTSAISSEPQALTVTSDAEKITLKKALLIGCAQAIALIPGTSRSGITLTAGYFLKLTPEVAARFSFLLSIPVIILSGLLSLKDIITGENVNLPISDIVIGMVLSFITAFIVIKLFLEFLTRFGLLPYVIYRLLLGAVLLFVLLA